MPGRPPVFATARHIPAHIPMTRRLFTLGSVFSLLLCIAAAGL
jgi:hypothetical protein